MNRVLLLQMLTGLGGIAVGALLLWFLIFPLIDKDFRKGIWRRK